MALTREITETLGTPRDFVQSGWDYQRTLAGDWVRLAQEAIGDLTDITIAPMTFEVPAELTVDFGTFTRPASPTAPVLPEVSVTLPAAPTIEAIDTPTLTALPEEPDFSGLVYSKPAAPNVPLPTRPTDVEVVLTELEIPDAPVLVLPDEPSLYAIDLPEVPNLTVPEFEGIRPVRDFDVPPQTFSWTPENYDHTLIEQIQARLSDMAINGLALPPYIEQAIFDRARGREDTLTLQATEEFSDELATRGLIQPGGLLSRGMAKIRAAARMRSSGASRELSIEMARMNVDAVRFALSTAIGLEMALVQANTANNELTLRAAQATQQVLIDLFGAKVALHNAEWEGFKTDAAVYEARIRALNAQAELYKSQIDGQKVIGDLNESLVRAYGETMRARDTLINLYRTQIEAAVAKGTLNTQKLEQGRLRLQGYETDVRAWGLIQDAHKTSVDAELGSLRAMEVLGNVYSTRSQVWRTTNAALFEQGRFQIEVQNQELQGYRALLDGAKIDADVQLSKLDGKLRVYSTQADVFGAEASVSTAESAAADRTASLRLEAGRLRVETARGNLELAANYALKVIDASIAQYSAKAQIVSQLAASTMSGVNFSASYGANLSHGVQKSGSVSWSGETADLSSAPGMSF